MFAWRAVMCPVFVFSGADGSFSEALKLTVIGALERDSVLDQEINAFFTDDESSDGEMVSSDGDAVDASRRCEGEVGERLRCALVNNTHCQSLVFHSGPRGMLGAIARGLKENRSIKRFELVSWDVEEEDGAALVEAVKCNKTLKCLRFANVGMDAAIGVGIAEALKHNGTLISFTGGFMGMAGEMREAFEEAFTRHNVALQSITFGSNETAMYEWPWVVERNKDIAQVRHALTGIARCCFDGGLCNLTEKSFRREVIRFFLPSMCKVMPVELAISRDLSGCPHGDVWGSVG